MNNENQESEVMPLEPVIQRDLILTREPSVILGEAKRASDALIEIISKKKKPVIFNGEQYLEFEDWQMVGKFYGLTAKVIETKYVNFDGVKGFESKAVVIHTQTGEEVSGAEAICLNDEPNWARKPLYQLKSMSQTRACAKSLRNVLAWVVVMAGYRATPAEELQEGNSIIKKQESIANDKGSILEIKSIVYDVKDMVSPKTGKSYWSILDYQKNKYNTLDRKLANFAKEQRKNMALCLFRYEDQGRFKNLIELLNIVIEDEKDMEAGTAQEPLDSEIVEG